MLIIALSLIGLINLTLDMIRVLYLNILEDRLLTFDPFREPYTFKHTCNSFNCYSSNNLHVQNVSSVLVVYMC